MFEVTPNFRDYFEYRDGHLYWKVTVGTRALKGSRAGKLRKDGYFDVGLKGKYYLVHRVVFHIVNGYLPSVIDHIDHNRSNNLVENLREASYSNNTWNARKLKIKSTAYKGIRLTKNGKFEARVAKNGLTYQVGTFSTIDEALEAVQIVRKDLHCEFACNG